MCIRDRPHGGKMLAVDSTLEEVRSWLHGHEDSVSIAAVNGPRAVVISGAAAGVLAVAERARAGGRRCKELEVSHAFHSPLMEPILDDLQAATAGFRASPARIPVVSNVTGDLYLS